MSTWVGRWAVCLIGFAVVACGTSDDSLGTGDAGDDGSSIAQGDGAGAGSDGMTTPGHGDGASGDGATQPGDDGASADGGGGDDGASADGAAGDDGALADATVGDDGSSADGTVGDDGSSSDATVQSDGATGTDGTTATGDGAGSATDGATGDGAATVSCAAFGTTCMYGSDCCSGLCDPKSHSCASSISATCAPATAPCIVNTDCCSTACVAGHCGAAQCLSNGATCPVQGNVCCTGNCNGGKCAPVSTSTGCESLGNACTADSQCCAGLCKGGVCALSSFCLQTGDICYHANDCCGGICTAPNNQAVTASNPGVCSQPKSGSVNCTAVDGTICPGGGCGQCCSRLCAPYGPTGVNICQPARGCRVEGDLCRQNSDCCGATGSGVLGDGAVICSTSNNGGAIGVCLTPGPTAAGGTCVPEGDVCHYNQSNYTCSISSARADCCGDQRPRYTACVLDPFGVPRCNAYTGVNGDAGVGCIASGNDCATATECCGGRPCVPSASGQLQCSANVCQSAGQSCTVNADCCPGLPCIAPPGSVQGTCSAIMPPPNPPPTPTPDAGSGNDGGSSTDSGTGDDGGSSTDSGTGADTGTGGDAGNGGGDSGSGGGTDSGISPDGGYVCALYGQACTLPCCAGTQCISGICSTF